MIYLMLNAAKMRHNQNTATTRKKDVLKVHPGDVCATFRRLKQQYTLVCVHVSFFCALPIQRAAGYMYWTLPDEITEQFILYNHKIKTTKIGRFLSPEPSRFGSEMFNNGLLKKMTHILFMDFAYFLSDPREPGPLVILL